MTEPSAPRSSLMTPKALTGYTRAFKLCSVASEKLPIIGINEINGVLGVPLPSLFFCLILGFPINQVLFGKKGSEPKDWKPLLPHGSQSFTGASGNPVKAMVHHSSHVPV